LFFVSILSNRYLFHQSALRKPDKPRQHVGKPDKIKAAIDNSPGYAVTQKTDNVSNHLSFVPTSTVRNHEHVDLGVNGKKEFSNFEIQ
jgi:hypothetical protein